MNIEEKAKRYDNIIEKANKMHHENCEACKACIEELIPELFEFGDKRIMKEIIRIVDIWTNSAPVVNGIPRETLLAWLEKQGEQKPAWSEEDEDKLQIIINIIKDSDPDWEELINWLKSLKEKVGCEVNCTTTKEWSAGDKVMLGEIIDFFENGTVKLQHDLSLYASWLKSIRPQSTWKPSDEQMRVLDLAIRCGINRGTTEETTLVSLFNDLKKLK